MPDLAQPPDRPGISVMNDLDGVTHLSSPVLDFPGMTDIHAHPALNAYLFNRDLRRHYCSSSTFNPLASLSDFTMLRKGDVRVLWSSVTVPERAFFECKLLWLLAHLTRGGRKVVKLSAWRCLNDMLDCMEEQVARTKGEFEIARSNADLDRIVSARGRAIVHTVEGGQVLEGHLKRLDELSRRGVASLTLAHLFPNNVAGHTRGISQEMLRNPICPLDTGAIDERGLTPFGRDVVGRMVGLRMIPDLTHASPASRKEVLDIVDTRVPVIASHSGVRELFPVAYNLDGDEIKRIRDTGGIVGVIFMPYWLSGHAPGVGLELIWNTMESIFRAAGTWDTVAIGTDFDGFTDPPDEVKDASRLPAVTRMLLSKGLSNSIVQKIIGGNARRVLREGWR